MNHQRIFATSKSTWIYADAFTLDWPSCFQCTGTSLTRYPIAIASARISASKLHPESFENENTFSAHSAVNALKPHCVSHKPQSKSGCIQNKLPSFPGIWRYHGSGGSRLLPFIAREQMTT